MQTLKKEQIKRIKLITGKKIPPDQTIDKVITDTERQLNMLYRGEGAVHVIWQGKISQIYKTTYMVRFDNSNIRMFAPYMLGIYNLEFLFEELNKKYLDKIKIGEEITFHFNIIPTDKMCSDIKVNSSKIDVERDKILADKIRPVIFEKKNIN
ncbi:MAG: hypothetical protein PHP92_05600 [Candidatus Nanoarchaeia archaeon]|nr:hypothetical protein [Candidatus Nanoarchaeia archaeon]